MLKVTTLPCLLLLVSLSTGCSKQIALEGLPESVFEAESRYEGQVNTVGELAEGYLFNTTALGKANNKLRTICVAALRCEEEQSDD